VRVRQRRAAQDATERHSALSGLLAKLEQGRNASARILAESGSRMRLLDVAEVELVAADRNYVSLTLGREVYHARSTLQQAQRALQSQPMLRISRSCLVNVNHVREVSRTPRGDFIFVLAGGATVTSSEGQREAVREYLARFRVDMAQGEDKQAMP
jgi:two-component system, LytTR family, response regulator